MARVDLSKVARGRGEAFRRCEMTRCVCDCVQACRNGVGAGVCWHVECAGGELYGHVIM